MNKQIILASGSPRRKTLLEWAEVSFEVIVKSTDESYPSDLAIDEVPVHIARQKALGVAADLSNNELIIAADTIVVLENQIIGKPTSREDAN
jgi:septum formation protein